MPKTGTRGKQLIFYQVNSTQNLSVFPTPINEKTKNETNKKGLIILQSLQLTAEARKPELSIFLGYASKMLSQKKNEAHMSYRKLCVAVSVPHLDDHAQTGLRLFLYVHQWQTNPEAK